MTTPSTTRSDLRTESDVEQKFLMPFLCHPAFLGIPSEWVMTKEYMAPTDLDKGAGRKHGYIPDYSIWLRGLPLVIVEAKGPDVVVEQALREARLYAAELNKRYPPKVSPVTFILASNGEQVALSQADSETDTLIVPLEDVAPGTAVLDVFRNAVSRSQLEARSSELLKEFQHRHFHRVASFMGGQAALNAQLGVNEFAEALFPVISRYFGNEAEEATDDIIQRGYVSSDETTRYGAVLETFLKDRVRSIAGNQLQPVETSRNNSTMFSDELRRFAANPSFFGRVQLVVGAVGAGKSTFIKRFQRYLVPRDVKEKLVWTTINFNNLTPGPDRLREFVAESFITSLAEGSQIDIYELEHLQKIFSVELNRLERGPWKLLAKSNPSAYGAEKSASLRAWMESPVKFAECAARHFGGDRRLGVVVVFDNVDRRSRDQQLAIFEAAQWFKELTRSLVIVNLRDSTFEAHRDEPPLDAFINAINFYIRPPRFARVIQRRLELVLEKLPHEVAQRQEYQLPSGAKVFYPASCLGDFLMSIYVSLFEQRYQVGAALEGLVARDVRRALGMFADILVSPHLPTSQITGAALTSGQARFQEARIIRSLMRGRYRYFNGRSAYIKNVLSADIDHNRPSNFLYADILEYLIRNRKTRVDFSQEGYALVSTVVSKMGQLGYDEADTHSALSTLVEWGLVEPESLILDTFSADEPVRVHASGFIHMRFLIQRSEYVVGITPDMSVASRELAEDIGSTWAGNSRFSGDLNAVSRKRILESFTAYLADELERRSRRHPFYKEFGHGGRTVVRSCQQAIDHLNGGLIRGDPGPPRSG